VDLLRKSNGKKPEEVEAIPSLKLQNIFTEVSPKCSKNSIED
jgi:hypothetical protein